MTRSILLAVLGLAMAGEPAGLTFSPPGAVVHRHHAARDHMVETVAPPCNVGVAVERTAWLMGTTLRAAVCAADRSAGIAAIEAMFGAVAETETRLSTWRGDSELSRANDANVGQWIPVEPTTAATLRVVRLWSERTAGAFDPAIGSAMDAWDLRGEGRHASPAELADATPGDAGSRWEVDDARPRIRRLEDVRLDAGGFGKGAGLAAALGSVAATGVFRVVLDFGGQVATRSFRAGEVPVYPVLVAHPHHRGVPVGRLDLGDASLATTGVSERYVEPDGQGRVGHVLDPESGRPVSSWGSVTVVADDPLVADILSTALFVMGPDRAADWSERHPEVGVLIVRISPSGGIRGWSSAGLARRGAFRMLPMYQDETRTDDNDAPTK